MRYYTFRELEDGLLETVKTRKARRAVTALFRAKHPAVSSSSEAAMRT